MSLLSLLLAAPFAGALLVALLPSEQPALVRGVALFHAILALLLCGAAIAAWDPGGPVVQLVVSHPWSRETGLAYALGVDGLSLAMAALTVLVSAAALGVAEPVRERPRAWHAWMLLLEGATLGVFLARDLALFTIFWELTLLPLFSLIGRYGGPRRHSASLSMVLYTMAGSAFMLTSLLALYSTLPVRGFDLDTLAAGAAALAPRTQALLLGGFLVAFAVKLPLVPLHGWLPLAQEEAPPSVSAMLSVKLGAYGLIRVGLILPEGAKLIYPWLFAPALLNLVYGALLAWRQRDIKAIIAWSSVCHMGFVALGVASLKPEGLLGAALQVVAQGLVTAALFLGLGLLERRSRTRWLDELGGLWRPAPKLSALLGLALFASIGFPGLAGFPAELHALVGGLRRFGWPAAVALVGGLLWSASALRLSSQALAGPVAPAVAQARDLSRLELLGLAPLAAATILLGIRPDWVVALCVGALRPLAVLLL